MKTNSSLAALIFIVILGIGAGLAFAMYRVTANNLESVGIVGVAFVIALVFPWQSRWRTSGKGW